MKSENAGGAKFKYDGFAFFLFLFIDYKSRRFFCGIS